MVLTLLAAVCAVGLLAIAGGAAASPAPVKARLHASSVRPDSQETESICTDKPGTGAPPENLGPYAMTEFEGGGPEGYDQLPTVDGGEPSSEIHSPAGVLKLSTPLRNYNDESFQEPYYNWLTWTNNYEGEVFWDPNNPEDVQGGGAVVPLLSTPLSVTITFPKNVRAFYTYVEPYPDADPEDPPNYADVSVSTSDGVELGPETVQGFHGASYFGCYNEDGLKSITVSSNSPFGFAFGEMGISAVKYVAMGDSFSSGEGNPPFIDNTTCDRSKVAYPELLAQGVLKKLPLAFVACSGATTGSAQNQFKSLSKNTKVVTLTFGGNNVGFPTVLQYCVIQGCASAIANGVPAMQDIPKHITELKKPLVATYTKILADAPQAAVYVLGYPYLFPPKPEPGQGCEKGNMSPESLALLAQWEVQLDQVIKEAAEAAGVTYVDPNFVFAEHDVCSEASWFNPITMYNLLFHRVYLFHPNAAGQEALERALQEARIGSHGNDSRVPSRRVHPSPTTSGAGVDPRRTGSPHGRHVRSASTTRSNRRGAAGRRSARNVAPAAGGRAPRAGTRETPTSTARGASGVFGPLPHPGAGLAPDLQMEGRISGKVTDASTEAGLPEICVYANEVEFGGAFAYATTEADGSYTIEEGLPEGSYEVEFYPCETGVYAPQWYAGVTRQGDATRVHVVGGETTGNIDGALRRSATISGKVVDATTQTGIKGVCVTATSTDEGPSFGHATTGADGSYSISTYLAADSYRLEFDPTCFGSKSSSYLVQFYDNANTEGSATPVTVAAESSATGIDAELEPSATISGTVTDAATHHGVGEVCVNVSSTDGGSGRGSAKTASDGTYSVSNGLYGDTYAVEFDPTCRRAGSSPYLLQYYQGAETRRAATPVAVPAGGTTAGVDAALQTSAKITGKVTDAATKAGIANVCVTATPTATGLGIGSTRSASDGSYTISAGLRTGSYAVEFDPSCSHSFSPAYAAQFYEGAATAVSATAVAATEGETTTGINAALQRPGTITGTVTEAGTGSPLEGVCVEAASTGGGSGYESVQTGATGDYTLAGLPAGEYKVEFKPSCSESLSGLTGEFYGEEAGGTPASVSVSPGVTTEHVNAALKAAGTISGVVTDTLSGSPAEGVCVDVASSSSAALRPQTATTASDGTYSITSLPAGSYTVEFDPTCGGFTRSAELPQFYENATAPGAAKVVILASGATVSGVDADLQEAGTISGTVTNATSGSPHEGVCVIASSTETGVGYGTATTASNGTYAVTGLAPGAYDVEFDPTCEGTSASEEVAQFYDHAPWQVSATAVTVTAGATTASIDAELQKPGEITGKVTAAASGAPLAEVCVEVISSGGGPGIGFAKTASDGSYSVSELPADSYFVKFEPQCLGTTQSGYEPLRYHSTVAVAAAQTTTEINAALSATKAGKAETATSLHMSEAEVTFGEEQYEQISVEVTSRGSGEPTGSVKVAASGKTLCKIRLAHDTGTCTLRKKKLKAGSYSVVATYKGAKKFAGSASEPAALVVKP